MQRTVYFFDLDFDLFFDFRCRAGPFLLATFLPVAFLPDPFFLFPFVDDVRFFVVDFTDDFLFGVEAFFLVDGFFFFAVFFFAGFFLARLRLVVVVAVLRLLLRLLFFPLNATLQFSAYCWFEPLCKMVNFKPPKLEIIGNCVAKHRIYCLTAGTRQPPC